MNNLDYETHLSVTSHIFFLVWWNCVSNFTLFHRYRWQLKKKLKIVTFTISSKRTLSFVWLKSLQCPKENSGNKVLEWSLIKNIILRSFLSDDRKWKYLTIQKRLKSSVRFWRLKNERCSPVTVLKKCTAVKLPVRGNSLDYSCYVKVL